MQINKDQTIGILGFGKEGQATLDYFQKHGYKNILIFDRNPDIKAGVKSLLGDDYLEHLSEASVIFRSPGIPYLTPDIQQYEKQGGIVTSATAFFLENQPAKVIGITGSNGKTTTATLIYEILKKHWPHKVWLAGNVGNVLLEEIEQIGPNDLTVMELSSFQLQDLKTSPQVAVVTNISPNHLDHHQSIEEYIDAKKNIVHFQAAGNLAVLNASDPIVKQFAAETKAEVKWFGDHTDENIQSRLQSLKFKTHPQNIKIALIVGQHFDISQERIWSVIEDFKGVPNRLEFVRELNGVRYYNDTSCTTPESTTTALEAFPEGSVIILLGGSDKGSDYQDMNKKVIQRKATAITYGAMGEKIAAGLPPEQVIRMGSDFAAVIQKAKEIAKPGQNIILSPACASFDMFKNYIERGEIFTEIVRNLK